MTHKDVDPDVIEERNEIPMERDRVEEELASDIERQHLKEDMDLEVAKRDREYEIDIRESDKEADEADEAAAYEYNQVSPEEAQERFTQVGPEDGGDSDVWQRLTSRQRRSLMADVDAELAQAGVKADDYRAYARVADRWRKRFAAEDADPTLVNINKTADVEGELAFEHHMGEARQNERVRQDHHVPESPDQIRTKFATKFPDLVKTKEMIDKVQAAVNEALAALEPEDRDDPKKAWPVYNEVGQQMTLDLEIEEENRFRTEG